SGRGRMPEPEAAHRTGILLGPRDDGLLAVLDELLVLVLLVLELLGERVPVAASVEGGLRLLLVHGDELGEHARERVDLVPAQRRPGGEVRLGIGQDALQTEQQAVAHLPGRRRRLPTGRDLREGVVESAASGASRRERLGGVLALAEERLAGPR